MTKFEEIKEDIQTGVLSYDEITTLLEKNIINKGQASLLRRLWKESWILRR